jgi:hypothetical protein
MRSRLRQSLFLAAAAASLLVARTAAAQFDGGTSLSTFAAEDFFVGVQHQPGANLSDFDVARFFNKANCDCDEPVYVYVALTNSGFAKRTSVDRTGNIEFWVGTDCANTSLRDQRCLLLKGQTMAAYLNAGRDTVPTNARVLSTYTGGGGTIVDGGGVTNFTPNPDCTLPLESFDQTIWVLSNVNGSPVQLDTRAIHIDLTPPPSPDPFQTEVQGGEEAVTISWQGIDSAIITDLLGYQILCNRGGDLQVFSDGAFKPGYLSCPATTSGTGVPGLDPRFICSPLLSATARSFRIKILQNGITYGAAVVAIDISGNASVPEIFYGTATKTKSFYDVYRNDDPDNPGTANGGFCTLGGGTTSRAALTGLCAGLAIAGIVLWRRRRRR